MYVVHDSADFNGTEANRTTENLRLQRLGDSDIGKGALDGTRAQRGN
jgi:hypothetical protein